MERERERERERENHLPRDISHPIHSFVHAACRPSQRQARAHDGGEDGGNEGGQLQDDRHSAGGVVDEERHDVCVRINKKSAKGADCSGHQDGRARNHCTQAPLVEVQFLGANLEGIHKQVGCECISVSG